MSDQPASARPGPPKRGDKPERAPSAWAEFRRALITPSPPALLLLLVIAGACWAAVCAAATPTRMPLTGRYFAENAQDTYAFATAELFELRAAHAREPERPIVVLLGASGIRYGLLPPALLEQAIGAELAARGADFPAPRVWSLLTDDQSILEMVSLMELLPESFDGVVLVGTNPVRLSRGLSTRRDDGSFDYRIGARSQFLEQAAAAAGAPLEASVTAFWANRHFFLPRIEVALKNLWRGAPDEFLTPLDREGGKQVSAKRWEAFKRSHHGIIGRRWSLRSKVALGPIARLGRTLESRGKVAVVLYESPMSPRARAEIYTEEFCETYGRDLEQFAAENGLERWELGPEVGLANADFFDWTHLSRAEARERLTGATAKRVAELLERSLSFAEPRPVTGD